SMSVNNKMAALKIASNLVIDGLADGDSIGIVSFNEDAQLRLGLLPLSYPANVRTTAKDAVDAITPGGCTSIGGGVIEAQSWLASTFDSGAPSIFSSDPDRHAMIVMSDGVNNANWPPWQYYTVLPNALTTDGDDGTTCTNDPSDNLPWYSGTL